MASLRTLLAISSGDKDVKNWYGVMRAGLYVSMNLTLPTYLGSMNLVDLERFKGFDLLAEMFSLRLRLWCKILDMRAWSN